MLLVQVIFSSFLMFFGSKYLKFKDKTFLTALKVSLLFCSIIYFFSSIPAIKIFGYLLLIYFIKYFYRTDYKNAIFLSVFCLLVSLILSIIVSFTYLY